MPDEQHVIVSTCKGNVNLWSIEGEKKAAYESNAKFGLSVSCSPDGRIIACGQENGVVKLWDVETCRPLHEFHDTIRAVRSISFTPDSQTMCVGSDDGRITLYSPFHGNRIAAIQAHVKWVLSTSCSQDLLLTGSADRTVKIWDISTRKCLETITDYSDSVWGVAWNTSGTKFVTGAQDGTLSQFTMVKSG